MKTLLIGVTALVLLSAPVGAEQISGSTSTHHGKSSKPLTMYQLRLSECGKEWKSRTDMAMNKGDEAWLSFRKECTSRRDPPKTGNAG